MAELERLQAENKALKEENGSLKKQLEGMTPEYQKRLQDGVMHELTRKQEDIQVIVYIFQLKENTPHMLFFASFFFAFLLFFCIFF